MAFRSSPKALAPENEDKTEANSENAIERLAAGFAPYSGSAICELHY